MLSQVMVSSQNKTISPMLCNLHHLQFKMRVMEIRFQECVIDRFLPGHFDCYRNGFWHISSWAQCYMNVCQKSQPGLFYATGMFVIGTFFLQQNSLTVIFGRAYQGSNRTIGSIWIGLTVKIRGLVPFSQGGHTQILKKKLCMCIK